MSRNLCVLVMFAVCIMGPSFVFVLSSIGSVKALGRNPSSAPKILAAMLFALVSSQSIAIAAILIFFYLLSAT